jgi:hypothetical protein
LTVLYAFALLAGGGTAFFLFARTLFDAMPRLAEHPRYAAGEVVGPIVNVWNWLELGLGAWIAAAAWVRRGEPGTRRAVNGAVLAIGAILVVVAAADRLFLLPRVVEIRAALGPSGFDGDASSPQRQEFGKLHGIENAIQLVNVVLCWIGLALERARGRAAATP